MWLDLKYVHLLSRSLEGFVSKGDNTFNFRCPLCGDSKRQRSKKRGYILQRAGKFGSYCHNCHESHSLRDFIGIVDPVLYDQYVIESYTTGERPGTASTKTVPILSHSVSKKLHGCLPASTQEITRSFLESRKIPKVRWSGLYFCDDFNGLARHLTNNSDKYSEKIKEVKLVIPLIDMHKNMLSNGPSRT